MANKVFGNAKQVGRNWGGMKFIFSAGDVTRDGIADATVFTWNNQRGSWSAPRVLITGLPMPLAMA